MASKPFPASYPGECGECFAPFDEGDLIRYSDDDEIVAEDCCGNAYDHDNTFEP